MSRPRIILCGATGRTGNAVAHALVERDDVELVACIAPSVATGSPTRPLPHDVDAFATLAGALESGVRADVLVDLTHADPAIAHLQLARRHGLPVVVGATGFEPGALETEGAAHAAAGLGVLHVPNFSLGAVLAMRIAADLACHFPDVEIVETHHDGKRDAPSGTAIRTAQLIAAARHDAGRMPGPAAAAAGDSPARGESIEGVPVHALRVPGATAHQEVVFGGTGELLTIRHDAIDRSCYAAGVALAARHVRDMQGFEIGLEHAL